MAERRLGHPEAVDVDDVVLGAQTLVMDDVALHAACAAIEPGHVHAVQRQTPDVEPVCDGRGDVTEDHLLAQGPHHRPATDPVPGHVVERLPHVSQCVGAVSETGPQSRPPRRGDRLVVVPGLSRIGAREEPVLVVKDAQDVHGRQ